METMVTLLKRVIIGHWLDLQFEKVSFSVYSNNINASGLKGFTCEKQLSASYCKIIDNLWPIGIINVQQISTCNI